MAKLTAFEIHTHRNGAWKIDSIFDDRERAVMEGERIGRSSRYVEVRVVEETFDEDTEKICTRTVYRSTQERQLTDTQTDTQEPPSPGMLEWLRRRRLASSRTPPPLELIEAMRRRRLAGSRTPPKKSINAQVTGKTILFVTITGIGLGLVYILNTIF